MLDSPPVYVLVNACSQLRYCQKQDTTHLHYQLKFTMKRNRPSGRDLGVLATLIVFFSTIYFAIAVECWSGMSEYPNVFVIVSHLPY